MSDLDMIKIVKQLVEKYGDKQIVVAIEELSELQKELCKSLRGNTNKEAIAEEIADVYIMLNQMQLYYEISDIEIMRLMGYKIKRTKERLLENEKEN